jgi:hypothetical protein
MRVFTGLAVLLMSAALLAGCATKKEVVKREIKPIATDRALTDNFELVQSIRIPNWFFEGKVTFDETNSRIAFYPGYRGASKKNFASAFGAKVYDIRSGRMIADLWGGIPAIRGGINVYFLNQSEAVFGTGLAYDRSVSVSKDRTPGRVEACWTVFQTKLGRENGREVCGMLPESARQGRKTNNFSIYSFVVSDDGKSAIIEFRQASKKDGVPFFRVDEIFISYITKYDVQTGRLLKLLSPVDVRQQLGLPHSLEPPAEGYERRNVGRDLKFAPLDPAGKNILIYYNAAGLSVPVGQRTNGTAPWPMKAISGTFIWNSQSGALRAVDLLPPLCRAEYGSRSVRLAVGGDFQNAAIQYARHRRGGYERIRKSVVLGMKLPEYCRFYDLSFADLSTGKYLSQFTVADPVFAKRVYRGEFLKGGYYLANSMIRIYLIDASSGKMMASYKGVGAVVGASRDGQYVVISRAAKRGRGKVVEIYRFKGI